MKIKMALSTELISQFAKVIVKDEPRPESVTVVGTAKLYDGKIYVQIDGSNGQLTPIASSTVGMKDGDRVTVQIKNHSATVTGNATDPSAGKSYADEIDGKVDDVSDQISEFEIVLADKVDVGQLNAVSGRIDDLVSENVTITGKLDAVEADITDLTAKDVEITGKLDAAEADIDHLESSKADITVLESQYATIENLNATNATVNNLSATYAQFEQTTTERLEANEAEIDNLEANKLDVTEADIKYANIDFTNIGVAAVEELFAKSGIIEDLVVSGGHITGELVGVTIKGDLIEGNTIKADKLVVLGSDGLYYKLNVNAETVSGEQTEYNSLNGSIITANTITAEKINVDDLVAFNATIGGYHISNGSLYSGAKNSATNTTRGVYLGSDGQFAVGDSNNYLKFFNDNGTWKLEISANAIKMGTKSVEEYVDEKISEIDVKLTESDCEGQPHVFGKNGGRAPYKLKVYGQTRQNLWSNPATTTNSGITVTSNADGSVTLSGTSTMVGRYIVVDSYILRPSTTYTLSIDKSFSIDMRIGCRINSAFTGFSLTAGQTNMTFTTPATLSTIEMGVLVVSSGTTVSGTYRVMLNEGSTAQPWCPPGLNGVDELSVVTAGKNLFKPFTNGKVTANDDGSMTVGASSVTWANGAKTPINLPVGTQVTISSDNAYGVSTGFGAFFFASDNSRTELTLYNLSTNTIQLSEDCVAYQCFFNGPTTSAATSRVMMEIGPTATGFEPYQGTTTPIDLDGHALNSLPGGTRDELTVDATGAVTLTQRVGTKVLPDDAASWVKDSSSSNLRYVTPISPDAVHTYVPGTVMSDALPPRVATDDAYGSTSIIAAWDNAYATIGSGETAQGIANVCGGKTLLYPLATPETISLGHIDLPAVPADAATIWYSVPTGLNPDTCAEIWTEEGAKVADAQKDAYEATQGAVKSQVVTYQAGTSGTTVPTGSWVSSPPSVAAGQYLWTRTVTTYVSGKVVTAYSIARQGQNGANGAAGAPGADGADGNGIKSKSITYQAHSSQTSAPTGTWSSSVPTLSATKPYLWTRIIFTYDDNSTSTAYTVGSTLDGVEVGGRNLLRLTRSFGWRSGESGGITNAQNYHASEYNTLRVRGTTSWPTSNTATIMVQYYIEGVDYGETYTFSFYAKGTAAKFRCYFYGPSGYILVASAKGSNGNTSSSSDGMFNFDIHGNGDWQRYWVTWTLDSSGSATHKNKYVLIRNDGNTTAGSFYVCGCKLEKGNVATEWSPAPEDAAYENGINLTYHAETNDYQVDETNPQSYFDVTSNDQVKTGSVAGNVRAPFLTDYGFSEISRHIFTISFDYSVSGITTAGRLRANLKYTDASYTVFGDEADYPTLPVGSSSGHVVVTAYPTNAQMNYGEGWIFTHGAGAGKNAGATLTITNFKMEIGMHASAWTPAPEDIDQSIQTARDQIITETQAYSENLNDSLTDYVGKTFYTKEEGSDLKTEVGEISTKLTQTENQFEMNFTNVSNSLADLSESTVEQFSNINKYIRFLNGDIILGEEGNATTLKIENDRIAFLDSNNEVMYITDQELYIMKAIIATQLTIGKFSWVPRSNGNVSFRYIG